MLRKMTACEIYPCATAYNKIKSRQIVEALYTDFTSWEGLLDFVPTIRAPNGSPIALAKDPAIIIGVAQFQGTDVAIIAQQTPPSAQERSAYNYGLTQADGYGLALCMMDCAEKYGLTLHTFIDTVGGDPFAASATKLQSWLIARCQARMLSLQTRSIATIIGQGGSGGAIALQLAHRRYMLALSTYSVIAPEGCAAILFRQVTEDTIAAALEILQPTAEHMLQYGIIDAIIAEPLSRLRTISPPPWSSSPRCSRGRRPNSPMLPLMPYSKNSRTRSPGVDAWPSRNPGTGVDGASPNDSGVFRGRQ